MKKELTIEERKKISLDILISVHNFCQANSITYFLHAGTLLGAIRHNGFIPWDDDIDISMPRPDYERFRAIYQDSQYQTVFYEDEKRCITPFLRVCDNKRTIITSQAGVITPYGIGIDVFPIDGIPSGKREQAKFFKRCDFIFHYFYIPAKELELKNDNRKGKKSTYIIKKIMRHTVFLFHKTPYYAKKLNSIASSVKFQESEYAGCLVALYRRRLELAPKSAYTGTAEYIFEGMRFRIPQDYDKVLSSIYGPDYMTPPPPEARKAENHDSFLYYKK